jgi:hypothetical protein
MQQQMSGQQLQQATMQEMHALHMQQVVAAAAAASSQQMQQQQAAQQMHMQQPQVQQQSQQQLADSGQQQQLQLQQQMQQPQAQQQASVAAAPQVLLHTQSIASSAPCVLPISASAAMPAPLDSSMQLDAAVAAAAAAAASAGRQSQQAVGMQPRLTLQQQKQQQQQTGLQQQQQQDQKQGMQQLGLQLPASLTWQCRSIPGMKHSQGSTMRLGTLESLDQVSAADVVALYADDVVDHIQPGLCVVAACIAGNMQCMTQLHHLSQLVCVLPVDMSQHHACALTVLQRPSAAAAPQAGFPVLRAVPAVLALYCT